MQRENNTDLIGEKNFRNEKWFLFFIFIIALSIRIIAVMNLPDKFKIPGSDAEEYDELAINLLSGKGFVLDTNAGRAFIVGHQTSNMPTTWRVPVYPLFLAAIYSIFGHNYIAVRIIQCIISALLCVIIYHIARLAFNKRIALLSAFILAFYWPSIYFLYFSGPGFLYSETLFTFIFAIVIILLMRNIFLKFSIRESIIAGILMGLATLTRPFIALFPLFLFPLFLYKNKYSFKSVLSKTLPFFISFIMVILPWTIRNYFVTKTFVPFSTEGGFALFSGNNPSAKGGGVIDVSKFLKQEERDALGVMSEVEMDKMYRKYAKEYILTNYRKMPKLFLKKTLELWGVFSTDYNGLISSRVYNIWYSIILFFGFLSIGKIIKDRLNVTGLLLILIFIYFSFISMVIAGEHRFRIPAEPYLIIFSSAGIVSIYDTYKNKFLSCLTLGTIIGMNFLFYIHSGFILQCARKIITSFLL